LSGLLFAGFGVCELDSNNWGFYTLQARAYLEHSTASKDGPKRSPPART
jgi:hypothetical protein